MINEKLRDFVCNVTSKGQIGYGDVRRLQRDCLPHGITDREELELLLLLNAGLVRADATWSQWLVAAVAEFVSKRDAGEPVAQEAECVGRLLATSTTSLGRKIARRVRCELRRLDSQSTNQPRVGGGEGACSDPDKTPVQSEPAQGTSKRRIAKATALAGTPPAWCLAGYLPAVPRNHFINFETSRACPVLAPCR